MDSLPNEIILLILEYCDVRSALKLIRTCKRTRSLKPLLKDRIVNEIPDPADHYHNKDIKLLFSFNNASKFTCVFSGYKVGISQVSTIICDKLLLSETGLVRDGKVVQYTNHLLTDILNYKNDKLHGESLFYHYDRDSKVSLTHQGNFLNGKERGRKLTYYEGGIEKSMDEYKTVECNGTETYATPNGFFIFPRLEEESVEA